MRRIRAWGAAVAGILAIVALPIVAQDQESEEVPAAEPPAEGTSEAEVEAEVPDPQPSAIDSFYDGLTSDNALAKVDATYGPQVVFEDPFGRVEGRVQLAEHYKKVLAGVQTFVVDVKEEFQSADETVAVWTMTFSHKSLNDGEPIVVDGVSHVRIVDGKIVGQKNYFDLGGMIYEHTTIVGSIVRWVKGKVLN